MKVREFLIAEPWLAQFHARLIKLNEKARAYDVPEFSFTELGRERMRVTRNGEPMWVEAVRVQLAGEPIAKGPWALVAALDERAGSRRLQLYREVPVAASYLQDPMRCEHCQTTRARRRTFIVMHTVDGFTEQVGRQCLADYTGISLEKAGAALRLSHELERLSEQAKQSLAVPRYMTQAPHALEALLPLACALVREYGWVRAEDSSALSTRDRLAMALRAPGTVVPKDCDALEAHAVLQAAREHFAGLPEVEKAFEARVSSIVQTGEVLPFELGIAAWLAHRFGTHRPSAPVSQHVGKVGERLALRAQVVRVSSLYVDGYGAAHEAVNLQDEAGNHLVWKTASRPREMQPDTWLSLRATVKAHSNWRGQAQTELGRVSVCEPVAQPAVLAG